ncbi:hypothetical protein [Paenibacillus xylanexedens]|uniref:hypothetical protein n=1 Tax=Paenibacillus xylanexedens TaxID=528191 RepID=UPI0011A75608|nr:hypothetical protein [Paenibacillus xylanexedens]
MNYIKISSVQDSNVSIITEITTNNFSVLIKLLSESSLIIKNSEIKSMNLIESKELFHIVISQIDRYLPSITAPFCRHVVSGGIIYEW